MLRALCATFALVCGTADRREKAMLAFIRRLRRRHTWAVLLGAWLGGAAGLGAFAQSDPLPSWNEGAAKKSITDFVARVTTPGGAEFVPEEQRIATFDNDGTLSAGWTRRSMRQCGAAGPS